MNGFYVYIYFRPDGRPCYVGKGKGNRWKRNNRRNENPHLARIMESAGGILPCVFLRENLSEPDAFELERIFIAAIGRKIDGGPLVNLTEGGGGTSGVKHTPEWCSNRSKKAKEVWQRPEYREKMLRPDRCRSGNKKPRSDDFKKSVSEKLRGNTHTLGYKPTEEARRKQSLATKGRAKSMEHRKKIALAHTGKKRTPEHLENMRKAAILSWERRKLKDPVPSFAAVIEEE